MATGAVQGSVVPFATDAQRQQYADQQKYDLAEWNRMQREQWTKDCELRREEELKDRALQRAQAQEETLIAREKQRQQEEEKRKLFDSERLQGELKAKAMEEFSEFDKWSLDSTIAVMNEHHVVLTYDELSPDQVSQACELMFSELPPKARQELTRMAQNAMTVVRNSRHVTEIADCRKLQMTFNIDEVNKSLTTRYAMAFRYIEVTETMAKTSGPGLLAWFYRTPPVGRAIVGIAFKVECATAEMQSTALNSQQVDAMKALGHM